MRSSAWAAFVLVWAACSSPGTGNTTKDVIPTVDDADADADSDSDADADSDADTDETAHTGTNPGSGG